jgi:hypothetical protein
MYNAAAAAARVKQLCSYKCCLLWQSRHAGVVHEEGDDTCKQNKQQKYNV